MAATFASSDLPKAGHHAKRKRGCDGFARPPRGGLHSLGGRAAREATSVGATVSPPGRPKAKCAPSGGSAVREATSVGASYLLPKIAVPTRTMVLPA